MTDRKTEKELYEVLIELFRILEDRVIDSKEGAQLCRACILILQKIRSRVPKLWQRITIDTVINILNEVQEYLIGLEP
jgi:exonuclease VII small subunit